ncbi:MAG: quinone-dependent dihydroorotate dehydrogenase [Janthinobacterium lividum]
MERRCHAAAMLYRTIRPALFRLDPERAHVLALHWLAVRGGEPPAPRPRLATRIAGLDFPNPIGIAAGLDKDGRAIDGLFGIGAGGVEIGTLTPLPQPGNPTPRMFRLVADAALINRLGFNNGGLEAGLARARAARRRGVLGINVGANKDSPDRIADYGHGVTAAARVADYVTINISSPNTPGLRDLQHGAALRDLLAACDAARVVEGRRIPLWLKVAPDLDRAAIEEIAQAAIANRVDALVVGNTTVSRPAMRSRRAKEAGGLSGAPLAPLARAALVAFRHAAGDRLPLVGVGGIGDAEDVYARIRAGASVVQLYTALVYEGPGLIGRMLAGLDALLARDGFEHVADAVGVDA